MTPDRALSLANDVECAIATLQAIADELRTAYPDGDYDRDDSGGTSATPRQKSVQQPEPIITLEQVRATLSEKSRNGKQNEVRALLSKYGADKLSSVALEHYAALLADATRVGLTEGLQ